MKKRAGYPPNAPKPPRNAEKPPPPQARARASTTTDGSDALDARPGTTAGYVVLVWEHRQWKEDWDGTVHLTREDGEASLRECSRAGYFCRLAACVLVNE